MGPQATVYRRKGIPGQLNGFGPGAGFAVVFDGSMPSLIDYHRVQVFHGARKDRLKSFGASMKVLFDLKHPAQVHFFKDAIRLLQQQGEEVLVTSRDKDETVGCLDALGIEHLCLSRMGRGLGGMGLELGWRTARMLRIARRFRPDVLVARTGITTGLVGKMLRVPSIMFEDTEFAWLQLGLSAPLATLICTGLGYGRRFPGKELRFNAPPHLAYTHPRRFTPSGDVLRRCGIDPHRPYTVLRVKAWRAIHDRGVEGPRDDEIRRLVDVLCVYGRVIISAERPLRADLRPYLNPVPVQEVLHLFAFARLPPQGAGTWTRWNRSTAT